MMMKTGRERLLAESSKLQDCRQRNCVILNVTVDSVELSHHKYRLWCLLMKNYKKKHL